MDETAFQRFYVDTAPALRAYIYGACGNLDLANDILQESFCRVLARNPSLDGKQMTAYLYKTATSLLTDHWRKRQREQRWQGRMRDTHAALPDSDLKHDMMRIFQELKPRQQLLLWLAYANGWTHEEIAEQLGLKARSVRVLLFRARKKLAALLQREGLAPEVQE